jgi:hypothetical protein
VIWALDLRTIARSETYFGVGLAVASILVSASPPVTSVWQSVDILSAILLGGGFVVAKVWRDDLTAKTADDKDRWYRRQMEALHRAQVASSGGGRPPRVRLEFSWEEGKPPDMPIRLRNAGGGEAFHLRLIPVKFGDCTATFGPIPPLSDNSYDVHPEVTCTTSAFLQPRTLLDFLKQGVASEERRIVLEGQAGRRRKANWLEDLDLMIRAAMHSRIRSKVEFAVTYEDGRGTKFTTRYQLDFEMFAEVTQANLNWIGDE